MSYQSITVCLEDTSSVSRLLDAAASLASTAPTHINCVHVKPTISNATNIGLGMNAAATGLANTVYMNAQYKNVSEILENIVKKESLKRNSTITWEWSERQSSSASDYRHYVNYALLSDVVVVKLPGTKSPRDGLPNTLLTDSATPIYVVPNTCEHVTKPRRIIVGWNNSRESSRAVRDALPLLREADYVRVVWVGKETKAALTPAAGIVQYLKQHNVNTVVTSVQAKNRDIGEYLLYQAKDHEADVVVMGGFGHSAVHELLFGAATTDVLKNTESPVFLSH